MPGGPTGYTLLQQTLNWLTTTLGQLKDAKFKLYTNNRTPNASDTPGLYVEASFTGYAAQTPASWTVSGPTSDGHFQATGAAVTYTNLGTGATPPFFGYFVTNAAGTVFLGAQLFSAPITLGPGQSFVLTPLIQDISEF
jgi:hypothetical protein